MNGTTTVTHHIWGWQKVDSERVVPETDCFAHLLRPNEFAYLSEHWKDVNCDLCFDEIFGNEPWSLSMELRYRWNMQVRPVLAYLKSHPTLPIAIAALTLAIIK